MLDRFRGALLGLATGDAVGTTVEFQPPGSFPPLTDMIGGGVFKLEPGQWTDDTSMALCLATSLLNKGGFDPVDQLQHYLRWRDHGEFSSNGRCFDIGNATNAALSAFVQDQLPFPGDRFPDAGGNGTLMRLAPIPMFFARTPAKALSWAVESARVTHGAPEGKDACRYFAGLILGALQGVSREDLLAPNYCPVPEVLTLHPLHPKVAAVAAGSFKHAEVSAGGYVVTSLEAALWAFHQAEDFRHGCLLAANLGDDADTVAAIYGQLAGAYFGVEGIPAEWLAKLAQRDAIDSLACRLYEASSPAT
ncbi:MAG: ADP-ribosylation/Crystallin [Cyanobacteria bacterium RYN_339]|nr:ADP-ribosylation/Crystallin [Cyanobacteria bacterium RYN_339]